MIALTYAYVPAEAVAAHVLSWEDRRPPLELPARVDISRGLAAVQIACTPGAQLIVAFERKDRAYLLDGPFDCPAVGGERHLDAIWRRTLRIRAPPDAGSGSDLSWVSAHPNAVDAWPRCAWASATAECWGVSVDSKGALVFANGDRVWWTTVSGGSSAAEFQQSAWARLIAVADERDDATLVAVIAHPVVSPARPASLRLDTAVVPNAHAVAVSASAIWVYGEESPGAAWIELRTSHAGPTYLVLDDVAHAPASLPFWAALDAPRTLRGVARGAQGPAGGAIVTLFRLIDAASVRDARADPHDPPRRVFAEEKIAGAAGEFRFDALGDVDYEIVGWHPQLGRGMAAVARGATSVDVVLESAGQVRGRVIEGGKPMAGVDVISLPDLTTYAQAKDPIDLKGGDGRTGTDGRFSVSLAPGGGGEVRVGGGTHPIRRFPLPRSQGPIVDLGDIDLGSPIEVTVTLDRDPGCDIRATGPVGRTGLQVIGGTRTGPGLFRIVFPEEGTWEVQLLCGRIEQALTPPLVSIAQSSRGKALQLLVRQRPD